MGKIKKTCSLQDLLYKKLELASDINGLNFQIRKNNLVRKGKEKEFDYNEIEKLKAQKQEDLVSIKLAIDEANYKNRQKNSKLIYERSLLVTEQTHQTNMLGFTDTSESGLKRKFHKIVEFFIRFSNSEVKKTIESIKTKIADIDNKLSKFNNETKVTLKVNLNW